MVKAPTFPVLWQGDREYLGKLRTLDCPRSVPWDFIADHADACHENHDQTPERLAERGGLAPGEMVAVVEATRRREDRMRAWNMSAETAVRRLKELLAAFDKRKADGSMMEVGATASTIREPK